MSVAAPAAVSLRPAAAADEPFLRRVYASTRELELSVIPWSREERRRFVDGQFDRQDAYYREHYDGASFAVVEVNGEPAGRLYVARWDDEIRVIDVTLLPEHRGRGVGTQLLQELVEEGRRAGKRVTIHVEKPNPARRLYEGLGFAAVEDKGLYLLMEAMP